MGEEAGNVGRWVRRMVRGVGEETGNVGRWVRRMVRRWDG